MLQTSVHARGDLSGSRKLAAATSTPVVRQAKSTLPVSHLTSVKFATSVLALRLPLELQLGQSSPGGRPVRVTLSKEIENECPSNCAYRSKQGGDDAQPSLGKRD